MQICQTFTQHSKSMQNDAQKRNFEQKNIDAEYFYDIVWLDFARWVIFTGQLRNPWQTLAEPFAEPRSKSLLYVKIKFVCICLSLTYSRCRKRPLHIIILNLSTISVNVYRIYNNNLQASGHGNNT